MPTVVVGSWVARTARKAAEPRPLVPPGRKALFKKAPMTYRADGDG